MLAFLNYVPLKFVGIPKPVFRWIVDIAEARQREITMQLESARTEREQAEARLREAETKLAEARSTAQAVIDGATKSGEQVRAELKEKAEEEAKRITESARKEIEAERDRAIQSARAVFELAGDEREIDEWARRLAQLRDLMTDEKVAAVLTNPTIPRERRMDLVTSASLEPEATNLAKLLIESDRVHEIGAIADEFQDLADAAAGRVRATLTTAIELGSHDRDRVATELSRRLGKTV